MKKFRIIFLMSVVAALITLVSSTANAQENKKTAEIQIKTSAVCDMCKETIEKHLSFEKGIKKTDLDTKTKILTVVYNPNKITPEQIRAAVSKAGYDADD